MKPQERILCDCGCDAPMKPARRWPTVAIGILLILVGAWLLAGCSQSDAKPPQHVLEIGDPVLVRSPFESEAACNRFKDRLIVVLHEAGREIPRPMRCVQ